MTTQIKVASVIDDGKLVINKGSNEGVTQGMKFIVYTIDNEIFDPDTKESLGRLETIRGIGKVTHLQETMATIESIETEKFPEKRIIKRKNPVLGAFGMTEEETISPANYQIPFDNPRVGDLAKQIP